MALPKRRDLADALDRHPRTAGPDRHERRPDGAPDNARSSRSMPAPPARTAIRDGLARLPAPAKAAGNARGPVPGRRSPSSIGPAATRAFMSGGVPRSRRPGRSHQDAPRRWPKCQAPGASRRAADWADLVLPARQAADPQDRRGPPAGWKLRCAGRLGVPRGPGNMGQRGVRMAVFAGLPGTGKTLAAEVIAGALGVDMLVVDLAGRDFEMDLAKPEKNLAALFEQAEATRAVLFFDEGRTPSFGKRTEVSGRATIAMPTSMTGLPAPPAWDRFRRGWRSWPPTLRQKPRQGPSCVRFDADRRFSGGPGLARARSNLAPPHGPGQGHRWPVGRRSWPLLGRPISRCPGAIDPQPPVLGGRPFEAGRRRCVGDRPAAT